MATAGAWAARIAEVQYSTDDVSYTDIEKARNPRFSGTVDQAESTSNDSSGSKEYVNTHDDGQLTFELIADENATAQQALWTSYLAKTTLYYRLRPRGHNAGDYQIKFQGNIQNMEKVLDLGDVAKYSVTIQKTGAPTRDTQ